MVEHAVSTRADSFPTLVFAIRNIPVSKCDIINIYPKPWRSGDHSAIVDKFNKIVIHQADKHVAEFIIDVVNNSVEKLPKEDLEHLRSAIDSILNKI